MERFLQQMTLKGLSLMTKVTWGSLRWELICKCLQLQLEYSAQQEGKFYA